MRLITVLLAVFITAPKIYGGSEYEKADGHARSVKYGKSDYRELASILTAPFKAEDEKARAIFTWIALNVSYDIQKFLNPPKRIDFMYETEEEKEKILQKIMDDGNRATLKSRKGVCEDYSNLFASMCRVSGISVKTIEGNTRNDTRFIGKSEIRNSHQWNALLKDGKWMVVDVTWGAGYVNFSQKKYVSDFREEYFLVPPEKAIFTHIPTMPEEQLLAKPLTFGDISELPVAGFGLLKYNATDFVPARGLIATDRNGNVTIKFRVKSYPELFLLTVGSKRSEIKPVKEENGILTFKVAGPARQGTVITLSGVDKSIVNDIISYKIR